MTNMIEDRLHFLFKTWNPRNMVDPFSAFSNKQGNVPLGNCNPFLGCEFQGAQSPGRTTRNRWKSSNSMGFSTPKGYPCHFGADFRRFHFFMRKSPNRAPAPMGVPDRRGELRLGRATRVASYMFPYTRNIAFLASEKNNIWREKQHP